MGSIWDTLPDGHLTFRFFANDTAEHINNVEITIIKDTSEDSGPEILGFNNAIIIGSILASMGFLAFKNKKKKII